MIQGDDNSGSPSGLATALARGTGMNVAGFAARVVLVSLHSLLAARLFGARSYGVYTVGMAAVGLLSFIGQVGFGRTITRFVALYYGKDEPESIVRTLKLVLQISMPASVAVGLVLGVGAEPMARLFGEPVLVSSFRVLALAVPALTLATLLAAFTQGFQRMRHKVIALDMVGPGVEVVGLVVLALLGAGQLGLPIAYTLSLVLSGALLIYYARVDIGRLAAKLPASASVSREPTSRAMLGFASSVWAVNILMNVRRRASVLMLGVMGTSASVGVFGVLQRLVVLGTTFLISFNSMFGPMVANLVERQRYGELSRLYKVSTRWMLIVSLPFVVTLGFFGREILQLYGPEFVRGSSALWYLAGALFFQVATGSCGVILMMSGRPQYSAMNEAIMLVTVVALNVLLIPPYGLLGAAWAVAAGTVMVNTLRVIEVWWHLRMHPYSMPVLRAVAASAAMSAVLWAWRAHVLGDSMVVPVLGLGVIVGMLVYGVVLIVLGLDQEELEMLRAVRGRLRRIRAASDQV